MKIVVTDRVELTEADLRPTAEQAPALALPSLTRLRLGVLLGEALLIALAAYGAHIELPVKWITLPLAMTLASIAVQPLMSRRFGARNALGIALVIDLLSLTAILALSGGPANPFTLLYLVQITLSAIVLSKAWTWSLGALSVAGFGFLFFVHFPVLALEGHHPMQGYSAHLYGMWIAFVMAAVLITIFIGRVSELLRNHERDLLRLQGQLSRNEKLASIAALAAGAAHELGTPLSTIAIVAHELEIYAAKNLNDAHIVAETQSIRGELERCRRILQGMSAEGAVLLGEAPARVDVVQLLRMVAEGFRHVSVSAPDGLSAVLPVESTRRALSALTQNAVDASGEKPVSVVCAAVEGRLFFTIRDEGCGMSAETLGHIAEPFFTTKAAGKGMGLGTFLARVFAGNMGGALSFESEAGKGTTVRLELPHE
jgi:two-component system sensor histidine kinase RegB